MSYYVDFSKFSTIVGGNDNNDDQIDKKIDIIKKVNFNFTDVENDLIDNIIMDKDSELAIYYENKKDILNKIENYFNNIGNENGHEIASLIYDKIISKALKDSGEQSCILWIRTSINRINEYFRWHKDGPYNITNGPTYKLVVTLKGNSTPVVINNEIIDKFSKEYDKKFMLYNYINENFLEPNKENADKRRYNIDKYIMSPYFNNIIGENYITCLEKEGIYMLNSINNDVKKGVIHSEPKIQKDRIFVAVICGEKDRCKNWTEGK